MLNQKLTGQQAADKTYIEDVFSTYLYTGNGSTQTINNGIDLAGKGGLVWIKDRTSVNSHAITDTNRGPNSQLLTNDATSQYSFSNMVTGFSSSGFSLGSDGSAGIVNLNSSKYASWTFRKAPKFFDVVTYTGNGAVSQAISHSLGIKPGMVIIKRLDTTSDWLVYHTSDNYVKLNRTNQGYSYNPNGSININSTNTFYVSEGQSGMLETNASGGQYVAYLFAHDTTTDGLIQCGSFTGESTVNLGWEPQYILIKKVTATDNWYVFDTMRGWNNSGYSILYPNLSNSEGSVYGSTSDMTPTATGFTTSSAYTGTYIYMAIRRGPMRTPTDGTKVFSPIASSASVGTTQTTGFPIDLQLKSYRGSDFYNSNASTRLIGVSSTSTQVANTLVTSNANSEYSAPATFSRNWNNTGFEITSNYSNASVIYWNFQRAPGFFDVVCYFGNESVVKHNLITSPELIIYKERTGSGPPNWHVYVSSLGPSQCLKLNSNGEAGAFDSGFSFNNTTPTASQFYVAATSFVDKFVAYLFASCPGVSKVGSYTGNGSSQTINCGFSAGARFVLIKRTNSTGDWYVWDTARGIVAGNDPHLSLNTTAAEVTTDDTIDPDSTGFIVNQVAATNVNVSGGSYIYLAIA